MRNPSTSKKGSAEAKSKFLILTNHQTWYCFKYCNFYILLDRRDQSQISATLIKKNCRFFNWWPLCVDYKTGFLPLYSFTSWTLDVGFVILEFWLDSFLFDSWIWVCNTDFFTGLIICTLINKHNLFTLVIFMCQSLPNYWTWNISTKDDVDWRRKTSKTKKKNEQQYVNQSFSFDNREIQMKQTQINCLFSNNREKTIFKKRTSKCWMLRGQKKVVQNDQKKQKKLQQVLWHRY